MPDAGGKSGFRALLNTSGCAQANRQTTRGKTLEVPRQASALSSIIAGDGALATDRHRSHSRSNLQSPRGLAVGV